MNNKFNIYHANGKGTGTALRLEVIPADKAMQGHLYLTLAPQGEMGANEGDVRTFPTFAWDKSICLRLGALDLGHVLSVFRGYEESIADGKGLIHLTTEVKTRFTLEHVVEPTPAYRMFAVSKRQDGSEKKVGILLTPREAMVLEAAITSSMGRICFGD